MKRYLRLKEWPSSSSTTKAPQAEHFANSDASLEAGPFTVRTDENGCIRSMNPPERLDHSRSVVVLGDSIIECNFVHEGRRVTDHAERAAGIPVLNGGVSGVTALQVLHVLTGKVLKTPPTAVILAGGIGDIACGKHPNRHWSDDVFLTPYAYLPQRKLRKTRFDSEPDLSTRAAFVRAMAHLCAAFGVRFGLAKLSLRGRDEFAANRVQDYETLAHDVVALNADTRCIAGDAIPLLDLDRLFTGRSDLFYDFYHFNAVGAAEAGAELGKFVLDLTSSATA